jgi:hypothetical protein
VLEADLKTLGRKAVYDWDFLLSGNALGRLLAMDLIGEDTVEDFPLLNLLFSPHFPRMLMLCRNCIKFVNYSWRGSLKKV